MWAVTLIDRHLPTLESRAFQVETQFANHELSAELVLLGQARRVNGLKAGEELARLFEFRLNGFGGFIIEAVVVAVITQSGRKFRMDAHFVFPLLVEERQQLLTAGINTG